MAAVLTEVHDNVRAGLRQTLVAVAGIPPLAQRAWENRTFTPVQDAEWIRDTLIWQLTNQASLGALALMRTRFTYLIDNFMLPDRGSREGLQRVGALLSAFNSGRNYSYGGQSFFIDRSGTMKGQHDEGGWWMVPFTVEGYVDVPNVI